MRTFPIEKSGGCALQNGVTPKLRSATQTTIFRLLSMSRRMFVLRTCVIPGVQGAANTSTKPRANLERGDSRPRREKSQMPVGQLEYFRSFKFQPTRLHTW